MAGATVASRIVLRLYEPGGGPSASELGSTHPPAPAAAREGPDSCQRSLGVRTDPNRSAFLKGWLGRMAMTRADWPCRTPLFLQSVVLNKVGQPDGRCLLIVVQHER